MLYCGVLSSGSLSPAAGLLPIRGERGEAAIHCFQRSHGTCGALTTTKGYGVYDGEGICLHFIAAIGVVIIGIALSGDLHLIAAHVGSCSASSVGQVAAISLIFSGLF